MRIDHVLDVDPPVEELVGLDVGVVVRGADVAWSSASGKKRDVAARARACRPCGDDLAQALGRGLSPRRCSRDGRDSSVIHAAGSPGRGVSARPKALVVLVKTKSPPRRRRPPRAAPASP